MPGIFEELVNMAKECATTNVGGGKEPPTHLYSEIEATFFEFQSAQKKVEDAGITVYHFDWIWLNVINFL